MAIPVTVIEIKTELNAQPPDAPVKRNFLDDLSNDLLKFTVPALDGRSVLCLCTTNKRLSALIASGWPREEAYWEQAVINDFPLRFMKVARTPSARDIQIRSGGLPSEVVRQFHGDSADDGLQSALHDLFKRHSPTTNVSSQRKPSAVMRLFSRGLNPELEEWPRRCYIHGPSRFDDLLPFGACLYHITIPGQPHVERPVEVGNNAAPIDAVFCRHFTDI